MNVLLWSPSQTMIGLENEVWSVAMYDLLSIKTLSSCESSYASRAM